jgi:hypothetical protein
MAVRLKKEDGVKFAYYVPISKTLILLPSPARQGIVARFILPRHGIGRNPFNKINELEKRLTY